MLSDTAGGNVPGDVQVHHSTCSDTIIDSSSSNPFIAKVATTPRKRQELDGISSLREGMARMDVSSRANSGDYSFAREKDKDIKDGAKGRDVSWRPLEGLQISELQLTVSSTDLYHHDRRR
jgi:hypothetical protein